MSEDKKFSTVICPNCRQEIELPAGLTGEHIECPACGTAIDLHAPAPDAGPTEAQRQAMKSRTIRIELPDL